MKKTFIIALCLILITSIFLLCSSFFKEDMLTKEEVKLLRSEYPYYDTDSNQAESSQNADFRNKIKCTDTYLYCEVIGEPALEEVYISSGVEEVDKKLYEGVEHGFICYHYPVRVIKDTDGVFIEGQEISYCYGVMYQDSSPSPEKGDKIVLPIGVGLGGNEGLFFSGTTGYYYVTDDGYVISAFRELDDFVYSGKKVDSLMTALQKTKEEKDFYLMLKESLYNSAKGKDGFADYEAFKSKVKNELVIKNQEFIKSLK